MSEIKPSRKSGGIIFSIRQKKDNHIHVLGKSWQKREEFFGVKKIERWKVARTRGFREARSGKMRGFKEQMKSSDT